MRYSCPHSESTCTQAYVITHLSGAAAQAPPWLSPAAAGGAEAARRSGCPRQQRGVVLGCLRMHCAACGQPSSSFQELQGHSHSALSVLAQRACSGSVDGDTRGMRGTAARVRGDSPLRTWAWSRCQCCSCAHDVSSTAHAHMLCRCGCPPEAAAESVQGGPTCMWLVQALRYAAGAGAFCAGGA